MKTKAIISNVFIYGSKSEEGKHRDGREQVNRHTSTRKKAIGNSVKTWTIIKHVDGFGSEGKDGEHRGGESIREHERRQRKEIN